jgi:uncharacterized membrane protein SirB2
MIEFYLPIKTVHIVAVLISGGLFFLRGMLLLNGKSWAMSAPFRYLSYSIDTMLLTAALMLVTMLPCAVFANGWLTVKMLLLLVYVTLGSFALKRGSTPKIRRNCFVVALIVYAFMLTVARTHQPIGWFSYFQ